MYSSVRASHMWKRWSLSIGFCRPENSFAATNMVFLCKIRVLQYKDHSNQMWQTDLLAKRSDERQSDCFLVGGVGGMGNERRGLQCSGWFLSSTWAVVSPRCSKKKMKWKKRNEKKTEKKTNELMKNREKNMPESVEIFLLNFFFFNRSLL